MRIFKKSCLTIWGISILYVIYESVVPRPDFPIDFSFADKFYHGLAYLWLAVLPAVGYGTRTAALRGGIFVALLGIGLEIVQFFLPMRSCEFGDMLADTAGVCLGFYLGLFLRRNLRSHKKYRDCHAPYGRPQ